MIARAYSLKFSWTRQIVSFNVVLDKPDHLVYGQLGRFTVSGNRVRNQFCSRIDNRPVCKGPKVVKHHLTVIFHNPFRPADLNWYFSFIQDVFDITAELERLV